MVSRNPSPREKNNQMKKKLLLTFLISFLSLNTANTQTDISESFIAQNDKDANKNELKEKSIREEIDELKAKVEEIDDLKEEVALLKKQVNILSALKISGFFDVSISNYKNKPNIFTIGDFELDLEHNYDHFQIAAALVFNEGADLGVGFIDYHLFGGGISPRGRLFQAEGLHLQIGRFDVPFGNDWRYYSPVERISATPPLTTELIMDGGYNDEGIRMLLNLVWFNASFYMLQGIEEQYSYGGNSFGGRIGITPFNNPFQLKTKSIPIFELGISYIHDLDREGATAEKVFAADAESKIGPFILTSEYYRRDKNAGILLYGYHITGALDFKSIISFPLIYYCRYDKVTSEEIVSVNFREGIDKNTISRFTTGININIYNISYLKLEYQNYLSAYNEYRSDQYFSKTLYYLQLVIRF